MSKPIKKPQSNKPKRIGQILIGLVLFIALLTFKIYSDVYDSNVSQSMGNQYVLVRTGQSYETFIDNLEAEDRLLNLASFKRFAFVLKLNEKLMPGRYVLHAGMNNLDLLKMFLKGRQEPLNVVFRHANYLEEVSGFFSRNLEIDSIQFLSMLKDTVFTNQYGFDSANLISLFIPNTYNFYWNTHALHLLGRMQHEYEVFWNTARKEKAVKLGLSQQQISTLASIVQKESNKFEEMPIIAGVYLNRLKLGMPLQADPTVLFFMRDTSIHRVLHQHTQIASPYNTYLNAGLPPGPICCPSIQAIDAVLNFVPHRFIYFCAKADFSGYHNFASNLAQHQNNARKYQKALTTNHIH